MTVWTKLHAIESMTASLQVPNVGWRQMYLLLCTVPVGWKPGSPIVAATLQSVAMRRQQKGITEEQRRLLAAWAGSAEAAALWHVLILELQDAGPFPLLREVYLGTGSVWMGDSVCLYYPLGKKERPLRSRRSKCWRGTCDTGRA